MYIGYSVTSEYKEYGANHGLMITHVNFKQYAWNNNTVNTSDDGRQYLTIVPADGETITHIGRRDATWAISQHGDLYPGENNVTEMTSYAVFTGETLGQTINNIVEHKDEETGEVTITVDINGGVKIEPEPEPDPEPESLIEPDIPELA